MDSQPRSDTVFVLLAVLFFFAVVIYSLNNHYGGNKAEDQPQTIEQQVDEAPEPEQPPLVEEGRINFFL